MNIIFKTEIHSESDPNSQGILFLKLKSVPNSIIQTKSTYYKSNKEKKWSHIIIFINNIIIFGSTFLTMKPLNRNVEHLYYTRIDKITLAQGQTMLGSWISLLASPKPPPDTSCWLVHLSLPISAGNSSRKPPAVRPSPTSPASDRPSTSDYTHLQRTSRSLRCADHSNPL